MVWLPPACSWTRDQTCNLGMYYDWELNTQPFGAGDDAPTNWATWPGLERDFDALSQCPFSFCWNLQSDTLLIVLLCHLFKKISVCEPFQAGFQELFFWFFLFSTYYCDCPLRFTTNSFSFQFPLSVAHNQLQLVCNYEPTHSFRSSAFCLPIIFAGHKKCRSRRQPSHGKACGEHSCIWHYFPENFHFVLFHGSSRLCLSLVISCREEFTSLLYRLILGRTSDLQWFSENCVHRKKFEKCSLKCCSLGT